MIVAGIHTNARQYLASQWYIFEDKVHLNLETENILLIDLTSRSHYPTSLFPKYIFSDSSTNFHVYMIGLHSSFFSFGVLPHALLRIHVGMNWQFGGDHWLYLTVSPCVFLFTTVNQPCFPVHNCKLSSFPCFQVVVCTTISPRNIESNCLWSQLLTYGNQMSSISSEYSLVVDLITLFMYIYTAQRLRHSN